MARISRAFGGGSGSGGGLVDLAPVSTADGTTADVLNIPDDAVYVAIMADEVQTNTANSLILKLGISTGFTGQPAGASMRLDSSDVAASTARTKVVELRRVGVSNEWIARGDFSGQVTLTGRLQRIQLTLNTISGNTNQFSGGQVAVQYSTRKGVGPIASTSDLPEGGNKYWTDARFNTAFAAKTTDDLAEGSTNHYQTDDRTRNALSTANGTLVDFNRDTGVLSNNTAAIRTAVDGRIRDASLDDLAGVPFPAANKILQRNAANTAWNLVDLPTGTIEGVFGLTGNPSAHQIIRRNAANTAWEYALESDDGGSESLSGLSDVVISDMSAGEVLVALDSTRVGNGKVGAAGLADGSVSSVKLNLASSTEALTETDGVVVKNGTVYETRSKRFMESDFFPIHLKDLALTGYTIHTGALNTLAAGNVRFLTTQVNNQVTAITVLVWANNTDDRIDLLEIFNEDFLIGVQDSDSEVQGIVERRTTIPGTNANVVACTLIVDSVVGDISGITGTVTFKSSGRAVKWQDLKQSKGTADADRLFIMSRKAIGDMDNATRALIPSKAGATELRDGTNDTHFVTPAGVAAMEKSVDSGTSWTFTYNSTDGANTARITELHDDGDIWRFGNTDANVTAMDDILGRNAPVRIQRDASNYIDGKVAYAWRDGNVEFFKLQSGATETGTVEVEGDSLTLTAKGALYQELIDEGFSTGGTSVTKASETEALAGTDDTKFMTPLRTHDVVDHLSHIAPYTALTYTTAHGAEMAVGTWNINTNGTRAWFRGKTQAQAEEMAREFLIDRYFILGRNGTRIEAQFTDVTNVAVSGSSIGVVQCDIGSHSAVPNSPTLTAGDNWDMFLLSPQAKALFDNIPHGSVTYNSLAASAKPGFETKSVDGKVSITGSYQTFPRATSNPSSADGETAAITPANENSQFEIHFWGHLEDASSNPTVDITLQRKIGTGSWTTIYTRTGLFFQLSSNHQATLLRVDAPDTTSGVKYRAQLKRSASASVSITDPVITVREIFK